MRGHLRISAYGTNDMRSPQKRRTSKQRCHEHILRLIGRYRSMALFLSLVTFDALAVNEWRKAGLYTIESQTVMPHLDVMRRIRKNTRRCVGADGPETFFPILQQPALRGCVFTLASSDGATDNFVLRCETKWVATGIARLWASGDRVRGALDVKMGGKNMTFSQYVDASRVGACSSVEHPIESN